MRKLLVFVVFVVSIPVMVINFFYSYKDFDIDTGFINNEKEDFLNSPNFLIKKFFFKTYFPTKLFFFFFKLIKTFLMHTLGEGNGNPLQYSYLENPVDGGAWWAAVHRVTQSQTLLQ